jgi:hypothetical protein
MRCKIRVSAMGTPPTNPEYTTNDGLRVEKMLAEYERAQESGLHIDTIIHEITAIVWGANTLLLGFTLEVKCKSDNQKLVLLAAFIGILMSIYVQFNVWLGKKAQKVAYSICREIEDELPLTHRLASRIKENYPQWKPGQVAFVVLTIVFCVGWFCVFLHALACLYSCR